MDEEYLTEILPIDGEIFNTSLGAWRTSIVSASTPLDSTVVTYIIDFSLEPDGSKVCRLDLRVPAEMLAVENQQEKIYSVIATWLEDEDDVRMIRV